MAGAPVRVLLKPVRPARNGIRADLVGDDELSGGVATWTVIDRPRRRQAVEYAGTSSWTYRLPLLVNGMETRVGRDTVIEGDLRALTNWAAQATNKTGQPPVLRLDGPLQTPATTRWVIEGLEWGPKVRNAGGRRIQQYVTVTLREYVAPAVRRSPAKKARDRNGKGKKKNQGKGKGKK